MMKLSGADIVARCLIEQGVDTVFGYPGGSALFLYDALYRYGDRISHYLTAHEQGASHAADGYARATGKTGVCFATSGPGATNLVTGIATAYMDSIPMVIITANVSLPLIGRDTFQEADITGITTPITKENYIVKDITKLADTIREAFYIASHGRPGPVLVDIPKDLTTAETEYEPKPPLNGASPYKGYKPEDIDEALRLLSESKRPFIFAGGGILRSGASEELLAFAERLDCPVSCSLMGLSAFPATHPLYTGMLGMHGTRSSNMAATRSDLFIAVGSRFSDRVISNAKTFAPNAKVLHIDIDRAEINKNITVAHSVVGDAKTVLTELGARLSQQEHSDWRSDVKGFHKGVAAPPDKDGHIHPWDMMGSIRKFAGDDAFIVTEVGQHQIWTAQYYKFTKPGTFVSSGGFGTMGFGLGAAMGAQLGNPDAVVVHVAGDGCIRMNLNEYSTVSHYCLPIITVLVDNGTLGMVRQWQKVFCDERYSNTTLNRGPDFMKMADAFGIDGYNVGSMDEFDAAMEQAVKNRRPAILVCKVDMDERVLPMVFPGRSIDEQLMD